jgi:putative ABC transport system permease protein
MSLREQPTSGAVYALNSTLSNIAIVRIAAENTESALAHIDEVWKRFVPEGPVQRIFLDEAFANVYRFYTLAAQVLEALAAAAGAIACIGLFGMAAYVTRRRAHEIGLRKTQGAKSAQILRMLLWDFSKPVLLGNLIAWPIAWFAARGYVAMFTARLEITPAPFLLALVGSLLVAWLAVGGFVWRAARVPPTVALRES